MGTELREDQLVRDEILYLPVAVIDPDPAQPRLQVDAELADSIAQHGVLQPIQVRPHPEAEGRWMLVDGERRYRGALGAKLKTIPAQITLEVEDAADRLVRQIVRNEGKPLTAVEEAKAFKRIIDERRTGGDKTYGVVQLAKELGIAKSTVSDRMALAQLPDFWLELIAKGPLQPSHAPLLAKWLPVPEKYHRKALEQMKGDYRWTNRRDGKTDERIYVDVFETLLDTFMPKFIKPLSEVPGYEGPTMTATVRNAWPQRKAVHAADPSKWQSIFRKRSAEKRSKTVADVKSGKKEPSTPRWVKAAVDAGAKEQRGEWYEFSRKRGEAKVGDQDPSHPFTWWYGFHNERKIFDPEVLLRELDVSKLTIYRSASYANGERFILVTTDNAALGQARSAYLSARADAVRDTLDDVGREILVAGAKAGRDQLVMGGAAPHLISAFLATSGHSVAPMLLSLAIASDCPGAKDVPDKGGAVVKYLTTLGQEPAETLLNAIAVITRDKIKTPPQRLEAWEKAQLEAFAKVKPAFGAAAEDEDASPDPAAKKATPRRRKNAVDEEALNAEATGEEEVTERDDADGPRCTYCDRSTLELEDDSYSWISEDPPVCSNARCAAAFHFENDPVVAESDDIEDLEPAHAGAED